MDPSTVSAVEKILNYTFKNKPLLEGALTHASFSATVSFEILEFIGDYELRLATATRQPKLTPGHVTVVRKDCVNDAKLARVAVDHGLYWFLRRNNTAPLDVHVRKYEKAMKEEADDDHNIKHPDILADIVKALAGAVYLDVNFDLTKLWMIFRDLLVDDELMLPSLDEADLSCEIKKAQDQLYGLCGKKKWNQPVYRKVKDEGPPHKKKYVYTVEIEIEDVVLFMEGYEKLRQKDARNCAAFLLIRSLQEPATTKIRGNISDEIFRSKFSIPTEIPSEHSVAYSSVVNSIPTNTNSEPESYARRDETAKRKPFSIPTEISSEGSIAYSSVAHSIPTDTNSEPESYARRGETAKQKPFSIPTEIPSEGSVPYSSVANSIPTDTNSEPESYAKRGETAKRKPVLVKVEELKPGTSGHTLVVKVVQEPTQDKTSLQIRPNRIAECLVGDETGTIIFTARNEQVDIMKHIGATLTLRNAKIVMFKGMMRLAVDKWGRIEDTEPAKFEVKEDNNLSLVEYELVNVVDDDQGLN